MAAPDADMQTADASSAAAAPAGKAAGKGDKKAKAGAGAGAGGAKAAASDAGEGGGSGGGLPAGDAGAGAGAAAGKKDKKKGPERLEYVNTTPKGEKKDMTTPMLEAYYPTAVEAAWDAWWEQSGFYRADAAKAAAGGADNRFVMVIPPPNVTGSLHLGHALTDAIEDALTRWHRMHGRVALWLPGIDHAGIATQVVVEKRLMKERNQTRHDLGREAFLKEVWNWKEAYGSRITMQMRRLGVSSDWSRECFTMDAPRGKAVTEAFVRMHKDGLIYRDTRLVNWDCVLRTAISDIELDYIDIEKRTMMPVPGHNPTFKYEFGCMWSFAYKIAGADGKPTEEEIVVATTRPETMLGDTAVAVHPADERYKHLHSAKLVHPFSGRLIPIVTDAELVDMTFGTGAVKITPAHDPNDYKCGRKHALPMITVFTDDGKINEAGAPFTGMMRFDCRRELVKKLDEMKLLRGKVDNKMRLALCSRSGDVIEPMLKPQWYVACKGMAEAAVRVVQDTKEMRIVPDQHERTWYQWLNNIQDWCISRQLWWGHRIPAYYVAIGGKPPVAAGEGGDPRAIADNWVAARTDEEALAAAAAKFGAEPSAITLEQDEDVLDTWFSSGLFPFSTLGWPDTSHPDFQAFYPNTLLETGHDILFFWVARMVMMGIQLTGKPPFSTVFLHAMVRDKSGRKMSKSLGNVIDPMEVINGCNLDDLKVKIVDSNLTDAEKKKAVTDQSRDFPEGIPECGADALRLGLCAYTIQDRDINLDVQRIVSYRQFCNKLWNATRFALAHLEPGVWSPTPLNEMIAELAAPGTPLAARDRWILSRLNAAIVAADEGIKNYRLFEATTAIYDFWLKELCDYYLELTKPLFRNQPNSEAARLARNTLCVCLELGLRLFHPFMPFVTEELWQRLPIRGKAWNKDGSSADPASIMIAPYPTALALSWDGAAAHRDFEVYQSIVRSGRSLRDAADLKPSAAATIYVMAGEPATRAIVDTYAADIETLLKAEGKLHVVNAASEVAEGCSVTIINEKLSVHLLLKGLVDPKAEVSKLEKKLGVVVKKIEYIDGKRSKPEVYAKVPPEVAAKETEEHAAATAERDAIEGLIKQYQAWM